MPIDNKFKLSDDTLLIHYIIKIADHADCCRRGAGCYWCRDEDNQTPCTRAEAADTGPPSPGTRHPVLRYYPAPSFHMFSSECPQHCHCIYSDCVAEWRCPLLGPGHQPLPSSCSHCRYPPLVKYCNVKRKYTSGRLESPAVIGPGTASTPATNHTIQENSVRLLLLCLDLLEKDICFGTWEINSIFDSID